MRSIVTRIVGLCAAAAISAPAMAALLDTGFEGPDFTVGALNGQPSSLPAAQQWLVSGGGTNATANVSTANPAAGTQAVRFLPTASQALNVTGFFSPIVTIPNGTATSSKFAVSINGVVPGPLTGGSEYTIILADRAHGKKAAELVLSFNGDILVDNGGPNLTNTGADWTTGAYQTFEIDVNGPAGTISYLRNGSTIFTGGIIPAGLNGSDTVDQLQFLSDNFGDPEFETADFDNVNLSVLNVPEPGMLGLLVGTLAFFRRRA